MKQLDNEDPEQTNKRQSLDRLCSGSGLLLSFVCCIALIHVEFRIHEHHRLISHSVTLCDKMETEILRKVEENYSKWRVATGNQWQASKGWFLLGLKSNYSFNRKLLNVSWQEGVYE